MEIVLEFRHVSCRYGRREVVHDASFKLASGEFLCLLGPNGSGKTTLLKTALGLFNPSSGSVLIDGEDMRSLSLKERARVMGYIPQAHTPPFPFRVLDVVLTGRTPHLSRFAEPQREDEEIALSALEELNILQFKDKVYTQLSGGERQLVLIARALAQQPRVLVMDEPTASLDFGNQYIVLQRMRRLTEKGISILMVTHNPDHALYCADKVVLMKAGRILRVGTPGETIMEESMQEMYQTEVRIDSIRLPDHRTISVCIPVPGPADALTISA